MYVCVYERRKGGDVIYIFMMRGQTYLLRRVRLEGEGDVELLLLLLMLLPLLL
jgi:hypothetical protein